jgi:hypothetical protein
MKITVRRHPGTPTDADTIETTYVVEHPKEVSYKRGYSDDRITIEPEGAATVDIEHAYNGVKFATADGEWLAVSMRDSGFEVHYWGDFGDIGFDGGWWEFKNSHVRSMTRPNEPLLGYATNRQLIEELNCRWSMGSTHPNYSTMTADQFGTDEYTVGDLTVAATPAPEWTKEPRPLQVDEDGNITGYIALAEDWRDPDKDAHPTHHDPMWEVPDEPWTPDQTKCYTCDGEGVTEPDQHDHPDHGTCPACGGTGLADQPGDQLMTAVFQAVGSASMCWEHIDRAGVFHSERAKWVGDGLLAWLRENGWHKG